MNMNDQIGKLKKVSLREIWKDEAKNFTPEDILNLENKETIKGKII